MNKNHVIAALATIVFIDEVIIARYNQRKFTRLHQALDSAEKRATFLADKLDKAEVPLTEFDRIAMLNL